MNISPRNYPISEGHWGTEPQVKMLVGRINSARSVGMIVELLPKVAAKSWSNGKEIEIMIQKEVRVIWGTPASKKNKIEVVPCHLLYAVEKYLDRIKAEADYFDKTFETTRSTVKT